MPPSTLIMAGLSDFWLFVFLTGDHDFEPPELTTAMGIGITVAIAGNVLISLALNVQKLAHRRVEVARTCARPQRVGTAAGNARGLMGSIRGRGKLFGRGDDDVEQAGCNEQEDVFRPPTTPVSSSLGLLRAAGSSTRNYGTGPGHNSTDRKHISKRPFVSRFIPRRFRAKFSDVSSVDEVRPREERMQNLLSEGSAPNGNGVVTTSERKLDEGESESDYLKSKLWWLGFLLMNVGELGNFISYAFAPASVVAPLGTFALMANCFFAPLMHGERFHKMDLLGIFIAIIGAVTVVLSSNTSDVRLDPEALVYAISQRPFIIFSCVYLAAAAILATLSEIGMGKNWVFVDVGLCALFGGFTVLSTKAVSTLLTLQWIEMFTKWITYPVILVLVLTGVGQIKYLNRALMRFDSKVVIPSQFVLFTLSAIIGSAVLYGDFKDTTFHQLVTFFYGCIATFLGVFIIAWVPANEDECEEDASRESAETGVAGGGRTTADDRSTYGSVSRRHRKVTLLPSGNRDTPSVRRRQSLVSIGVSPAQHLLLVHTPPRDTSIRRDAERDAAPTLDPINLRHTISWFDNEVRRDDSVLRVREEGEGGLLED